MRGFQQRQVILPYRLGESFSVAHYLEGRDDELLLLLAELPVLLLAAATASMIDGAGNVPFLRAVRGAERAEMAGVYGTFRDVSQLAPPAIAAVVLQFAALPAVFGVVGTLLFGQAYLCKYLPRRM